MNPVRLERQARLISGSVFAAFVVMHVANHAAGIVSVAEMERWRPLVAKIWQNPVGTVALYGSLAVHVVLALKVMYRRSTLKLPRWELVQLLFGLAVPFLLLGHIMGTRLSQTLVGFDVDYPYVVSVIWSNDWYRVKQVLLLIVVWIHLCVGLHFAFRVRRWYTRCIPYFYAVAILLPVLSLIGYARAGTEMMAALENPSTAADVFDGWRSGSQSARDTVIALLNRAPYGFAVLLGLVLIARQVRLIRAARRPTFVLRHPEAGSLHGTVGATVLETLRKLGVPHAAVCGGRARCTTCRVRIDSGLSELAPPSDVEEIALARIAATERVRLACQLRPVADLSITPLLAADADARDAYQPGGVSGREQQVVAMFVDLRASTGLGEKKLPYDVVFILNQFFTEMSLALETSRGHYAQFAGDGLLALYGLEGDIEQGCRDALIGAAEMTRRLDGLNARLGTELESPLRIGIGVHSGDAIVGTMGPPTSPLLSAIGDNINIAARLEAMTKQFECTLILSKACADTAGVNCDGFPRHEVDVRGREGDVAIYAVGDPRAIEPGAPAAPST